MHLRASDLIKNISRPYTARKYITNNIKSYQNCYCIGKETLATLETLRHIPGLWCYSLDFDWHLFPLTGNCNPIDTNIARCHDLSALYSFWIVLDSNKAAFIIWGQTARKKLPQISKPPNAKTHFANESWNSHYTYKRLLIWQGRTVQSPMVNVLEWL